jgi:hypothetical protein
MLDTYDGRIRTRGFPARLTVVLMQHWFFNRFCNCLLGVV